TPPNALSTLPPLPSAEAEGRQIGKLYPIASVLTAEQATAERFVAMAPSFGIIHFAGHALTTRNDFDRSALVCASSSGESGLLTAPRIAQMHLPTTQLVLLAACSTSTGRNAAVEGVASLSRAFLIAGAAGVLGTLWDIDDHEIGPMMAQLHERIARGVPAAKALRDIQIRAIHDSRERVRDPRTWAAFALTGWPQPTEAGSSRK
ncbi:MAG TPA: CHAT domain-containing protein, partial [Thermoanaerobaculia bacterium]|nr:CHAT domain-containing protein [Thermoanaerobaculia bacterium]